MESFDFQKKLFNKPWNSVEVQQVVVLFTRITLRLWYFLKREGMNKKANCVMSFDFSLHSREFVIKIRKINKAISLKKWGYFSGNSIILYKFQ